LKLDQNTDIIEGIDVIGIIPSNSNNILDLFEPDKRVLEVARNVRSNQSHTYLVSCMVRRRDKNCKKNYDEPSQKKVVSVGWLIHVFNV